MLAWAGRLAAVVLATSSMAGIAMAQQWSQPCPPYYPIRAVGAACTGDYVPIMGTNACCKAAPSTNTRRGSIPSQRYDTRTTPGQIGAAIGIAGALLGIIAELVDMFGSDPASSAPSTPDYSGERNQMLGDAARLNREGIALMRAGEDRTAAQYFKRALQAAQEAGDAAAAEEYTRNLYNVLAQSELKEAIRLDQEGFFSEASRRLAVAHNYARKADRVDLAERIEKVRQQVYDKIEKLPASQRKEIKKTTECVLINGQHICTEGDSNTYR